MSSSTDSTHLDDATEWEQFRGGKFWHHALAGAAAGVSEHLVMFPFDTIKVLELWYEFWFKVMLVCWFLV